MSGRRKRRARTQGVKARKGRGLVIRVPAWRGVPYDTTSLGFKAFEDMGHRIAADVEKKILGDF